MQGNRNRQRLDSSRVAALGLLGIVILVFIMAISNLLTSCNSSTAVETTSKTHGPPHNYWVPTSEDILYQDSMYQIIKETDSNMDTCHTSMDRIIQKLDIIIYNDGQRDSVRSYEEEHVAHYEEYTDEYNIWIGGNGDTIYE